MTLKIISSHKNPKIKNFLNLRDKSRERKKQNCFVVEGKIEIERALSGNYRFKEIYICEGSNNLFNEFSDQVSEFIIVESKLFNKVSFRNGSEKYIGIGHCKDHSLENLQIKSNGVYLIAQSIEKPGNIGALMRTSAALGINGFISVDPLTDLYNPISIRSSLGAIFNQLIIVCNSESLLKIFKTKKINILSSLLNKKSTSFKNAKYTRPCAIVVGNESKGLKRFWSDNSDQNIYIPMKNNIDSLNVSVAAAILAQQAIDN